MSQINIANGAGRDAVVTTQSMRSPIRVRWLDEQGRQAGSVRVVKATIDRGIDSLKEGRGELIDVALALVEGDPEIDLENTGRFLRNTSRIYVDENCQIVHRVKFWKSFATLMAAYGNDDRAKVLQSNVGVEVPLRWSGVYIDRAEACRKFVFCGKLQLHHINGLTYDFLYGMAQELEQRDSLMLFGAGPKSNQPLILRRGSTPHRGFLEGRTDGEKYCLMLHFSNMELKAPAATSEETTT